MTTESSNVYVNEQKSQKTQSKALWALLIISLLGNAFLAYHYYQNNFNGRKSVKTYNQELLQQLTAAGITRDSLLGELDRISKQFEDAVAQSVSTNDAKAAIEAELESKKIQIARLIANGAGGNSSSLLKAKGEIENLKKQLNSYQLQIDNLTVTNQEFKQINADLQKEAENATYNSELIQKEAVEFQAKVKSNVFFQVSELKIIPQRSKKGNKVPTTKASKVENLKISFDLIANELISKGNKEIALRILGTNDEVLTNENDVLTDSDQLISYKYEFSFNGENESVNYSYKQKPPFKKGVHVVEVVQNGKVLTRGSFILE
jgi:hypothetical protein